MKVAELLSKHEAQYKASVMYATWGHLDACPAIDYEGTFEFAYSAFDDYMLIDHNFKGPDKKPLSGGPGLWEHIHDFIYDQTLQRKRLQKPGIYRFTGKYNIGKRDTKKHLFKGVIRRIDYK